MPDYTLDTALLDGIRKGDSTAFRNAHVQYFAMVRYFVTQNGGREEDAHDVFQDALVILYEHLRAGTFEQRSSLKTWLYAVCRNRWLKQLARNGRMVPLKDFEPVEPLAFPNENEHRTDAHYRLREALTRMGGPCHKLLLLFYYFRKSMEEIAEEMNYANADTAKNQKYKCLQRLRAGYATLANR